jgi:Tfp pilus assembly protein PilO
MSPRRRLIAVIAALAAVNLLFLFFFIGSRRTELGDVKDDIEATENQAVRLRATLARLEELQGRAPRLQAQLSEVRSFVPPDDDVANFIFQVQEAADEAGVGFVQVTPELPKAPPEGTDLAQARVVIGTRGGYFSIQDFIRRLYDLDRAVRIDNLSMSTLEDEERAETTIQVELTVRIFFEPPAGGSAAVGAAPAPEAAASPSPSPSPSPTPEQ